MTLHLHEKYKEANLKKIKITDQFINKIIKRMCTFTCNFCTMTFQKRSHLKQHITSVHEPQYSCAQCDMKFPTSIDLEQHKDSVKYTKLKKKEIKKRK